MALLFTVAVGTESCAAEQPLASTEAPAAVLAQVSALSEIPSPSVSGLVSEFEISPVVVIAKLSMSAAAPSELPDLLVISNQMGVLAERALVSLPVLFSVRLVEAQLGASEDESLTAITADAIFTAPPWSP